MCTWYTVRFARTKSDMAQPTTHLLHHSSLRVAHVAIAVAAAATLEKAVVRPWRARAVDPPFVVRPHHQLQLVHKRRPKNPRDVSVNSNTPPQEQQQQQQPCTTNILRSWTIIGDSRGSSLVVLACTQMRARPHKSCSSHGTNATDGWVGGCLLYTSPSPRDRG